jgi:uncharacterized membrane protein YhaH (DUF805 family)
MEIFLSVLKNKYADFSGRARRQEYWNFMLFLFIFVVAAYMIVFLGVALDSSIIAGIGGFLTFVILLASIIPSLAVTVRRLHDTNRSGWFYFIGLIPLIGGILLLVWYCTEGTHGDNDYGPDPKGSYEIGNIGNDELV